MGVDWKHVLVAAEKWRKCRRFRNMGAHMFPVTKKAGGIHGLKVALRVILAEV